MKTGPFALALMIFFLVTFGLAIWLDIGLLTAPTQWIAQPTAFAALLGSALLVADVVMPATASLVMMYNGALFGLVGGTLLSLVGGLGATVLGFWLGRHATRWLPDLVSTRGQSRAGHLLEQWGGLAIVITRPVPILAETTVILAGTTPMGWLQLIASSALGLVPTALLYAWTGATAATFPNHTAVFATVLGTTGLVWLIGQTVFKTETLLKNWKRSANLLRRIVPSTKGV